jgi:hypothetical protein
MLHHQAGIVPYPTGLPSDLCLILSCATFPITPASGGTCLTPYPGLDSVCQVQDIGDVAIGAIP